MATYKFRTFTLEPEEMDFTIPATLPTTNEPIPNFIEVIGNALANTLTGNTGDDTLDGRAGADRLLGGLGDDTYIVDDAGDVVEERQGEGLDRVKSAVSFVLGANLEDLSLTGSDHLNGTGNDLANRIFGNNGNNVLDGGASDDTIFWSPGADQIIGGSGLDTVSYLGSSAIKVNLATGTSSKGDKLSSIENVSGSSFNDTLTGNAGANRLEGGNGADKLNGGNGNDTLLGSYGNDVLTGGAGRDVFVFDYPPVSKFNYDKIVDYKVASDLIWLDKTIFTKLGKSGSLASPAKLNKKFFAIGIAKDKNDYVLYDTSTGVLSYDADGSGRKAPVGIAKLTAGLKMTYGEFFLI